MKKLIALMMTLCLLCDAVAAVAETTTAETTAEKKEFAFPNGIKFGMSSEEVAAIEGGPGKQMSITPMAGSLSMNWNMKT